MTYRKAEIGASAGLILLAIFGWFQVDHLPADALMFPGVLLAVIAALSLWMLLRALRGTAPHLSNQAAAEWQFAISRERMLGGFALLAGYLVIVPLLGFFTTSLIFVMLVAWVAGYRHLRNLVLTSVGFCLFVYLIFVALFARPLPKELLLTLFSSAS